MTALFLCQKIDTLDLLILESPAVKKGSSKSPNMDKAAPIWKLYPLYGLLIEGDDGLNDPLWGDATLISYAEAAATVDRRVEQSSPLLNHGKLAGALGKKLPGNAESLVEITPHSYIAVRSQTKEDQSRRRAARVRALLSGTRFLRGLAATAFCGSPKEFAWYVAPRDMTLQRNAPPKASIVPLINPNIVQRPISANKAKLRESVKTGTPVGADDCSTWDIHREHSLCRALNAPKPSTLQKRATSAALLALDASCATSNFNKLQIAVTAFEVVLGTRTFSEIGRRVPNFIQHGKHTTEEMLDARHELTHRSREKDEAAFESVSMAAVMQAWTLVDFCASFADHFTADEFDKYVEALDAAHRLDEAMKKLTGNEKYSSMADAFYTALRPKNPNLTLIAAPRFDQDGNRI